MSCRPLISGVLLNLNKSIFVDCDYNYTLTKQEWTRQFDYLQNIGCNLLCIFAGVKECMERTAVADPNLLEFIFSECDQRQMEIIISTGSTNKWSKDFDVIREAGFVASLINKIFRYYGSHPSFSGWYLPYELFIRRGQGVKPISDLFRSLVESCKRVSPNLPVSISPFFMPDAPGNGNDFRDVEPTECVDFWSNLLSYAKIDILALQDNGGQHLSCFRNKDTRPFIEAFATACRNAGTKFWGNVEMGEFQVADIADFVARYGVKGDVNNPRLSKSWRAVPIEQLVRKLKLMSPFSERNISWGYHEFYRPTLGEKHKSAYDDYRNYYQEIAQE
ncbi:MAG: DUF4434 domain-containing protein [Lentisphaeria bacterium]